MRVHEVTASNDMAANVAFLLEWASRLWDQQFDHPKRDSRGDRRPVGESHPQPSRHPGEADMTRTAFCPTLRGRDRSVMAGPMKVRSDERGEWNAREDDGPAFLT
jgi:hypothetical protein